MYFTSFNYYMCKYCWFFLSYAICQNMHIFIFRLLYSTFDSLTLGFLVIQCHSLFFIMNNLLRNTRWSKTIDYIFLISSFSIFIFFCVLAFYDFNYISPKYKPLFELFIFHISNFVNIRINLIYYSFINTLYLLYI